MNRVGTCPRCGHRPTTMVRLLDTVQASWSVTCEQCGAQLQLRTGWRWLLAAGYFAPELLVLFPLLFRVIGYRLQSAGQRVLPAARTLPRHIAASSR